MVVMVWQLSQYHTHGLHGFFRRRRAWRVAVDVTPVFASYFARNRGPVPGDPEARQPPDYGVLASLDGDRIDLALTFRAGSAYCCYEAGCHLDLLTGKRWEWLRRELSVRGL